MNPRHHLLLLSLLSSYSLLYQTTLSSFSPNQAYPTLYADDSCAPLDDAVPKRTDVHGRIIDITHRYVPDMPSSFSNDGTGQVVELVQSMKNGSVFNGSKFKLHAHAGTHVDAPGHFYDEYYDAGFDIDSLDLEVLIGPALLVDVPRDTNITAVMAGLRLLTSKSNITAVMKHLSIPKGVHRVLFRTLNTDRKLMLKKELDTSFVGFMEDGAKWLVENTDIKLIGLDYLSVGAYVDAVPTHHIFLKSREIILVEALKLDHVKPGLYNLHCLPLRLVGSEGSPARCILIT